MDTRGTGGGALHAPAVSEDPAASSNGLPMKVFTATLTIDTQEKEEIRNLTEDLASLPALRQIAHGFILIHSLHTTAGLCLNEFQDALLEDIKAFLQRLVPSGHPYRHNDPVYSGECLEPPLCGALGANATGPDRAGPIETRDLAARPLLRVRRSADEARLRPGDGRLTPRCAA